MTGPEADEGIKERKIADERWTLVGRREKMKSFEAVEAEALELSKQQVGMALACGRVAVLFTLQAGKRQRRECFGESLPGCKRLHTLLPGQLWCIKGGIEASGHQLVHYFKIPATRSKRLRSGYETN